MSRKLFVLLVVAALSIPASAAYIGFDDSGNSGVNPLGLDFGGGGSTPTPPPAAAGWQTWTFASTWTGPANATLANPNADWSWEYPTMSVNVYRKNQSNPNVGASRSREGGFTCVLGTGDFSPGTEGFGMNYVQISLDDLKPKTNYKIYVWDFENAPTWSMSSTNPDSKFIAWSATNPKTWLDQHSGQYNGIDSGSYDPNGYGPIVGSTISAPRTDSNMPGSPNNPYNGIGLYQLVLGRVDATENDAFDHLGEFSCETSFHFMTDGSGNANLFAWQDATDWTGSMHCPVNGLYLIPEPTTIVLLGLGGLALIRRKRA